MISRSKLLWLARAGFAGRGAVFLILGAFAGKAALGLGAQPVGATDALRDLLGSWAGWAIVLAIAVGLLCFAAFRALEAAADVHGYGDDLSGIVRRAGLGAAGLFYAGLAVVAASIVFGWHVAAAGDQQVKSWTAWLLGFPGGAWLVGIAGVITVGAGVGLAIAGLRGSFQRRVRVDGEQRPYVRALGMVGLVGRSVVFVLIGAFLVFAAVTSDPSKAQGFGGALRTIQHQSYGDLLLGVAAIGLLAFGLFGMSEAVFARVKRG